jgi:hypothetical protein
MSVLVSDRVDEKKPEEVLQTLHGRKLQTKNEVREKRLPFYLFELTLFSACNKVYYLPADGVEMEVSVSAHLITNQITEICCLKRLSRQHLMLKKAVNALYWPIQDVQAILAPREGEKIRILDVGSGSGAW